MMAQQTQERYIIQRATLQRLLTGIKISTYFWLQSFKDLGTVTINTTRESVRYGGGCGDTDNWMAAGTSHRPGLYCNDFDQDHYDIYPLTVMLVRAVGIPIHKYFMMQLVPCVYANQRRHCPLFEKHLLSMIVEFL